MTFLRSVFSYALLLLSSLSFAQGVTDREVLIGQFAAFSGPAVQLGQRMQTGILAHFDAINAQGGVNGR